MFYIRKHCTKVFAVFMAVLVVFATGNALAGNTPTTQTAQTTALRTTTYDGEAIFRGVLMGDGPVAKLFPEVWEAPPLSRYMDMIKQQGLEKDAAIARQQIVDALNAQDPTFFSRFGIELTSGDRIRTQAALSEAGTRLQTVMESLTSTAPAVRPPPYLYVYLYVVAVVAAVVAVAAVLVLVVVAAPTPNGTPTSSTLQRDVYVDLIAQRLAAK